MARGGDLGDRTHILLQTHDAAAQPLDARDIDRDRGDVVGDKAELARIGVGADPIDQGFKRFIHRVRSRLQRAVGRQASKRQRRAADGRPDAPHGAHHKMRLGVPRGPPVHGFARQFLARFERAAIAQGRGHKREQPRVARACGHFEQGRDMAQIDAGFGLAEIDAEHDFAIVVDRKKRIAARKGRHFETEDQGHGAISA